MQPSSLPKGNRLTIRELEARARTVNALNNPMVAMQIATEIKEQIREKLECGNLAPELRKVFQDFEDRYKSLQLLTSPPHSVSNSHKVLSSANTRSEEVNLDADNTRRRGHGPRRHPTTSSSSRG